MEYCGFARTLEAAKWRCPEEFAQLLASPSTPLALILRSEELFPALDSHYSDLVA